MQKDTKKGTQMIKVDKINKIKYLHILIIILGAIFVLIANFHTTLWFDESYSVAIAKHSFLEIWNIGSNDVHPIIYYMMLKMVGLITGKSILAYRLFSCIPLVILGILGLTHIKKDFGEKTGLFFSFLVLFMPVTLVYSGEIRMYTWAMLFVTLTAIYGYRIYKSGIEKKNWIIFSIFSLLSAYTHYYALIIVAVINIALFIYFLSNNIKQRNYEVKYIKYSKNLKYSIIFSIIQIIIYLPWLGTLLMQFGQVSNGFWIGAPNFLEIFEFQFTGNLGGNAYVIRPISYIFAVIISLYIIYLLIKNWKDSKVAKLGLALYFIVMIAIGIISLKTPILYARYFLNLTGIFLFVLAFLMAKDEKAIRTIVISCIILVVGIMANITLIKNNYHPTNNKPKEFIEERIKPDDIIIGDNNLSNFIIATYFPDNEFIFCDVENWNVEKAYKAFGKTVYNLDDFKDFKGRIWVLRGHGDEFLIKVLNALGEDANVLENKQIFIKYQENSFNISLIEK